MDSAGRNNIFGDMGSPCLGLMFLKFGEIPNSARRRGLGRNAGNSKYKFKIVPSFIISYFVWSKGIHPRHPPREFPLDPLEEKVKKKRWSFSTHRRKEIAGIFAY